MAERTQTSDVPPPPNVAPGKQTREQNAEPLLIHGDEPPDRGFLREHPIKSVFGFLILVALIVGAILFWKYSQTFESTDDAFIDGHTHYISPRISGTINKVLVVENQFVQQGQLLAEIDPSDYQVAFERAQADAAQARAQIRSQRPAIPITTTTSQSSISATEADISNAQAAKIGRAHV